MTEIPGILMDGADSIAAMKIDRTLQLLFRWEEISAAVPEGSEDRERERRAIETMVGETWVLQDRSARGSVEILRQLRALMEEMPDGDWPAISGDGVQRRCTLELAPTAAGPCLECVEKVGSGPVGWIGEPEPGPLCDRCLAQASPELAAVLGLVSFFRQLADADLEDSPEAEAGLLESLLIMTQVYARSCAGAWPSRPIGLRAAREQALELMRQRHGEDWANLQPDDGEAH